MTGLTISSMKSNHQSHLEFAPRAGWTSGRCQNKKKKQITIKDKLHKSSELYNRRIGIKLYIEMRLLRFPIADEISPSRFNPDRLLMFRQKKE